MIRPNGADAPLAVLALELDHHINHLMGEVQDVFNKFLGNRPVFTIRLNGGVDGMEALNTEFDIEPYVLGDGSTISQVLGRKGN